MSRFQNLRTRANKRALALLAIFSIALSGTGLASLAVINDNVQVSMEASVATIDLNANGQKSSTIAFGFIEPGDVKYAAVLLTNSGNSYVNIPATFQTSSNGISLASKVITADNVSAANCNETGRPVSAAEWSTAAQVNDSYVPWPSTRTIDAGGSRDVCFIFTIGQTGSAYGAGNTNFIAQLRIAGFYP